MRITYGAKEFESGLDIIFKVYTIDGIYVGEYEANEVSDLGIYEYDIPLPSRQEFIIGISEPDNINWKAYKYITTYFR